ncbi:hypothetical protein [Actinacidiphila soli]|uniref:hypothetical protein n=1 Tax=Actinacidiphila soli TaxID=2487275 RepID=UPI000FCB854D|nr:hypothetical protein [Actinacidiphila soli]
MLITGVGVGFALPTLVGAAASALPPHRFATGSAVTTMARLTGAVLGVALMVTLLGEPRTADAALAAFARLGGRRGRRVPGRRRGAGPAQAGEQHSGRGAGGRAAEERGAGSA